MCKVAITGAKGKMGAVAKEAFALTPSFEIVAEINREDNFEDIIEQIKPDICLQLAGHEVVFDHTQSLIDSGIATVIGSSGLTRTQISTIGKQCNERSVGVIIIPNFSMAVAQFSNRLQDIQKMFPDREIKIIEYHHTGKKDAPSGTARHLAFLLGIDESAIESVRNDEYHARHEVVFSQNGETISFCVDTTDRKSYSQGIVRACEEVIKLRSLKIGLESII